MKDYSPFKTVIIDFYVRRRAFQLASIAGISSYFSHGMDPNPRQRETPPQLLVHPDARIRNVEYMIDSMADQLAEFTLIIKNKQTVNETPVRTGDLELVCKRPGHGTNRYTKKSNRDKKCHSCRKIGHKEEVRWLCKKNDDQAKKKTEMANVTLCDKNHPEYSSQNLNSTDEGNYGRQLAVVVEENGGECEVMAVKRGEDGHPMKKTQCGEDGGAIASRTVLACEYPDTDAPVPKTKVVRRKGGKNVRRN